MKKVLASVLAVGVAMAAVCAVAEEGAGNVAVKAGDSPVAVKMVRIYGTLMVKKDAAGAVESIVIKKGQARTAVVAAVEVKLIVADQAAAVALDGKKVIAKGTMEGDALKVVSLEEAKAMPEHAAPRKPVKAPAPK